MVALAGRVIVGGRALGVDCRSHRVFAVDENVMTAFFRFRMRVKASPRFCRRHSWSRSVGSEGGVSGGGGGIRGVSFLSIAFLLRCAHRLLPCSSPSTSECVRESETEKERGREKDREGASERCGEWVSR